ncbi:class I SAM-dependent methyltransferase [Mycobacterium helveticum]|uniref:Class I SAM-dependent methyltransferase n=1 Tax=Mycobacterium helveticum TaxID=2592811 RepID=A0A557XZU4_9MYCO|nr:class I SAM-dependent methyltransferase [Mycobacterium helveticum]TVS87774.1 class I SAM-dependent methyltransferase [Mycobacterium helveticum]TVS91795.1 class I SAM-dependent methyltransferase [Mycobacterium helveticum]
MDVQAWDSRYGEAGLLWGIEPNRFVAAELAEASPGRALDVACGEGRNAIWLAGRGWHVVGVDFSVRGLERAAQLASHAGVADRVDFQRADVVSEALPTGSFDAVIVAYLQLAQGARRAALRNAAAAVAPGGTLLVVGHDTTNLTEGVGGPQDAEVLFSPDDVVADLTGLTGFVVQKAERVRRPVPDAERDAVDSLVRLRRETRDEESRT